MSAAAALPEAPPPAATAMDVKPLVSVVDTLQSGRYVGAATDIPAGTLIHASLPFVLVPHPTLQRQQCVACFRAVDAPAGTGAAAAPKKKNSGSGGGKGRPLKNGAYLQMKAQLAQSKAASSARAQASSVVAQQEEDEGDDLNDDAGATSQPSVAALQCGQCPAVYCSAACKRLYHPTHMSTQECLSMKIATDTSAHRKPREVHFLAIVLNIVLRAASEGCAQRLLQKPTDAAEVLDAAGDLALSAATVMKETIIAGSEESMSATDPGLQTSSPAEAPSTIDTPEEGSGAVGTTTTTAAEGHASSTLRSVGVSSTIPSEATRIRSQHEARGFVEVVDPQSRVPRTVLEDIMRSCSHVPATFMAEQRTATHLTSLYQHISPSGWGDYGLLVTNLSVISKDRLSEYRALYRYFLKAIALCPGDLFGLDPPPPPPNAPQRMLRRNAPPPANFVGDRTVVSSEMFYSICGALQCNAFGVYNHTDACVAIGSYPFASYFNHSCAPNICRVMEGRIATFYTLCDVPSGTPLCICYCEVDDATSLRRAHLLSSYRFHCECMRCSGSEVLRFDRCRKCTARGYLVPHASTADSGEGECSVCRQPSKIVLPNGSSRVSS